MSTAVAEHKEKTKAKKRYLKAKKQRRKKRKTLPADAGTTGEGQYHQPSTGKSFKEDVEDQWSTSRSSEDEPTDTDKQENQNKRTEDKRPRKRQKLDLSNDDIPQASTSESEVDEDKIEERAVSPPRTHRRSPTPTVALPLFPLPTQPDAPSRSTLALQGLDKALLEAEIIEPTMLQSFPSAGPSDGQTGLGEKIRKRLQELGITELFAGLSAYVRYIIHDVLIFGLTGLCQTVQTAVVPFLLSRDQLKSLYLPYNPPEDVCVSAPTGSGKTLAYVLPIVEILSTRTVTRLRALVVLPTRDLVTQVRETFEAVAKGRGLKIGTATGQHSFIHEQGQLVADRSSPLSGGSSKVDILISTPGRLIDHLKGTPNFSLQHLRFLPNR